MNYYDDKILTFFAQAELKAPPRAKYILEKHKHWQLVIYARNDDFAQDGIYKQFCKNCAQRWTDHFRGNALNCYNRLDVEDVSDDQS